MKQWGEGKSYDLQTAMIQEAFKRAMEALRGGLSYESQPEEDAAFLLILRVISRLTLESTTFTDAEGKHLANNSLLDAAEAEMTENLRPVIEDAMKTVRNRKKKKWK